MLLDDPPLPLADAEDWAPRTGDGVAFEAADDADDEVCE